MEISEEISLKACRLLLSLWADQHGLEISSMTFKPRQDPTLPVISIKEVGNQQMEV